MYNAFFKLVNHLGNSNKVVFYDEDKKITGNQYRDLIISFALRMRKHGVTRSSVVALDVYGAMVGTALSVACGMIGCTWVKYSIDSMEIAEELGITHIFHESPLEEYKGSIKTIPLTQYWSRIPSDVDDGFDSYDDIDKPFLIGFSSGTTGIAKPIKISYREYFERVNNNFDIQFKDAQYGSFLFQPLKSTTQYKAVSLMLHDIPIIYDIKYEDLPKYPGVHIIGSHGQVDAFVRDRIPPTKPYRATADLSGSATTIKYLENVFQYFDQVNIGYGATETSRTSNKRMYSAADFNGSSGYPFPDIQYTFSEDGVLFVKTPRAFNKNGEWFEPGDLGYMKDGELFITGRKNEQLNVGGVKIDPVAVENEIRTVDGVLDCMVFVDDTQHVEYQLSALVVTANREVSREIHAKCNDKFGISKVPQNIYYVEKLPMTEGGKLSRKLANDVIKDYKRTRYVHIYM